MGKRSPSPPLPFPLSPLQILIRSKSRLHASICFLSYSGCADEKIRKLIKAGAEYGIIELTYPKRCPLMMRFNEIKTTEYFEKSVMARRPYIRREWCEQIRLHPIRRRRQKDGRSRHWGYVPELGVCLRVITEPDGVTIHNAIPDRDFTRRWRQSPGGYRS